MVEITKNDSNRFNIKIDNDSFFITFEGNDDLYFGYMPKEGVMNSSSTKDFYITKENYFLYELFDNLYKNVKDNDNGFLFKDGLIDWHSDDFVYDKASCLKIIKLEDEYKIQFEKNKEDFHYVWPLYTVRISNSGSRYKPHNIEFMKLYNKLKDYNPNHQMHFEEILYRKRKKKDLR